MKWRAFLKVSSTSPFSSRRVSPPAWSQCRCGVTTASTPSGVMPRRRKACSMPSGSRSATCRARFSLSLLPIPVSQTMTRPFLRAIRQTHAQSIMLFPSGGFCFSHRTLGTTPNIRPPSAFQWSVTKRWSSRSPSCTAPYMLREMAVAAISTSQLTKDYGAGRGLFDLGLHVSQQEVFGYLGPNGSGKTTTIRLLMGMIRPTNGSAHVFGLDCFREAVEVKRKVGYLPGDVPQFGSFFFSSRRRHTRFDCDWSSDVCSSDLHSAAHLSGLDLDQARVTTARTPAPGSTAARSEERRVGKECRSRWSPYH